MSKDYAFKHRDIKRTLKSASSQCPHTVMNSIFKKVADKCYNQAKELAPNGINFGPYEEVKSPPPAHINQRCTMTPTENKMSEIKTETHFGKVYQINQEYLFSDNGTNLTYGRLKAICPKSTHPFESSDVFFYKYIAMLSDCKDQGTITCAPIKLIEGNAYKFDCDDHIDVIGLFSKCGGLFLIHDGAVFNSCFCTNIRPMAVVEEVSKTDE
jgi:hypothetical protein